MRKSVRGLDRLEIRCSGLRSPSGAPQVAQNRAPTPAVTGEPHRAHAGPDPGAVSRRPQWAQNGSASSAGWPQKGQVLTPACSSSGVSAWSGWSNGTPMNCVAGTLRPAALACLAAAAAALIGLPQSIQYCALASFARPQ